MNRDKGLSIMMQTLHESIEETQIPDGCKVFSDIKQKQTVCRLSMILRLWLVRLFRN